MSVMENTYKASFILNGETRETLEKIQKKVRETTGFKANKSNIVDKALKEYAEKLKII